jgi:hypothetical protein
MPTTPPPLTDQQLADIRRYRAAWLSARNRSAGYQQRYRYERKLCRSADIRATKAIRAQLVAEHSEALALAEARRLRAERDQARAELASYEILTAQQCPARKHPDWLVDSENAHPCPWCETARLRSELAIARADAFDEASARFKALADLAPDSERAPGLNFAIGALMAMRDRAARTAPDAP